MLNLGKNNIITIVVVVAVVFIVDWLFDELLKPDGNNDKSIDEFFLGDNKSSLL